MNLKTLILVLTLFQTMDAAAESWKKIEDNDYITAYIDTKSIKLSPVYGVRYFVRLENLKDSRAPTIQSQQKFMELNCNTSKIRVLFVRSYPKHFLKGEVSLEANFAGGDGWIKSDLPDELNYICSKK